MKNIDELNRDAQMSRIVRKSGIDSKEIDMIIRDYCAATGHGYGHALDGVESLVDRFPSDQKDADR